MTKIELQKLTVLIHQTMKLCQDFPGGGIGTDGPFQDELDDAINAGHPFENDDTYHRAQQIWINLNQMTQMLGAEPIPHFTSMTP